jgi:PAS domain S-box-containing protein
VKNLNRAPQETKTLTKVLIDTKDNDAQYLRQMQNQLFSRAVQISFDAIIMGEISGIITYANDAAIAMFGFKKEELIGKHVLDFVAPQDKQRALKLSLESVKTGQGYLNQFIAMKKDQTELPIEVTASVITDQNGAAIGFIDVIRSLDERIKTQEIIKENKDLYQNLFFNMPVGFAFCQMLFDDKGKPEDFIYLEINDAFECLTGIERKKIMGKRATEAFPGIKEVNPEIFEIYGKVSLTGDSERFEILFKPLNIWLDITVYSPRKGFFAAVFENTTKQKEVEAELAKYSKHLELTVQNQTDKLSEAHESILKNDRLAAIGELAGMVGHDLRNPLSGIRNAAYYIRKKQSNLADSSLQMLNIIDEGVEYSNKIINDLMDFSRELHLEYEECSPKSLLDYVLLSLSIPSNIKVVDKVEIGAVIWVDSNKIQRVFTNLIKNAFEAMLHGGTLTIKSSIIGCNVEFIFSDTGEGMSEGTLAKIFTPLFTTKAQGMGFGLAICKRIIEAHGGNISVSSIKGQGTTFKIELPIENFFARERDRAIFSP